MKYFSILAAVLTALQLAYAIPANPSPASVVATCMDNCPRTFCIELWPQSCYCNNNAILKCWYECGGVQPQLQVCTPLPSSSKATSRALAGTAATISVSATVATSSTNTTSTSISYTPATYTSLTKRDDSLPPTLTPKHSFFGHLPAPRSLAEVTEVKTLTIPSVPKSSSISHSPIPNSLTDGVSITTVKVTSVKTLTAPSTSKSSSFNHSPTHSLTDSAFGTTVTTVPNSAQCSTVTHPCKGKGQVCKAAKDAPCRWMILGICDQLGTCQPA